MAETTPAQAEPVDLIAGRYLPQRMLGRGGAKEVWLAHDLTLDRPVQLTWPRIQEIQRDAFRPPAAARMTGHEVEDGQSGYRVVAAPLLRRLSLSARGYLIETEVLLKAARHVPRFASVPVRAIYD